MAKTPSEMTNDVNNGGVEAPASVNYSSLEQRVMERVGQNMESTSTSVERAEVELEIKMGSYPAPDKVRRTYPEMTDDDFQAYINNYNEFIGGIQQRDQRRDLEIKASAPRDLLEVGSDLGASVGIGALRLGQAADTLYNLPSNVAATIAPDKYKTPEESAFSKTLQEGIDYFNKTKTVQTKFAELEGAESQQEFKEQTDTRNQDYQETFGTSKVGWFLSSMVEGAKELGTGAASLATNPLLLTSVAVENIPQLLAGAGVSKASTAIGETIATKAGNSLAKSTVIRERAVELGITANVLVNGLSEGDAVARSAREKVLETPIQDLIDNDPTEWGERRALLDSDEAVRESLANDAFIIGLGVQGAASIVTARLTGSSASDAKLLSGKPDNLIKSASKEGAEEAINEGTGQASENFAVQQTADSEQTISEDVAFSAGQGAVAGPATSTAVNLGVKATGTAINTPEAVKTVKDNFNNAKTVENIKKGKETLKNSTNSSVIADSILSPDVETNTASDFTIAANLYNKVVKDEKAAKEAGLTSKDQIEAFGAEIEKNKEAFKKKIADNSLSEREELALALVMPDIVTSSKNKKVKTLLQTQKEYTEALNDVDTDLREELETELNNIRADFASGVTPDLTNLEKIEKREQDIESLEGMIAVSSALDVVAEMNKSKASVMKGVLGNINSNTPEPNPEESTETGEQDITVESGIGLDPTIYGDYRERIKKVIDTDGSLKSAVGLFVKDRDSTMANIVARMIYEKVDPTTKIAIYDSEKDIKENGKYTYGITTNAGAFYDTESKHVYIAGKEGADLNENMQPETILHEALHALTHDKLKEYNKYISAFGTNVDKVPNTPSGKAFKELYFLYEEVKKRGDLPAREKTVKLRNMDEFISYGLTNAEFASYLEGIKITEVAKKGSLFEGVSSKFESALDYFKQSILRLVGIETTNPEQESVLFRLLDTTNSFLSETSITDEAQGAPANASAKISDVNIQTENKKASSLEEQIRTLGTRARFDALPVTAQEYIKEVNPSAYETLKNIKQGSVLSKESVESIRQLINESSDKQLDTAADIKNAFDSLSPRAKLKLGRANPQLYSLLKKVSPDSKIAKGNIEKIANLIAEVETLSSPKALKQSVKRAITEAPKDANTVLDSVRVFASNTDNATIERIKDHPLLEGVSFRIGKTPKGLSGTYNPKTRTATISSELFDETNDTDFDKLIETVIHETVHPITVDVFNKERAEVRGLSNQHESIVRRVKALDKKIRKELAKDPEKFNKYHSEGIVGYEYAISQLEEFPTKVMTDPAVQRFLKAIVFSTPKKTAFGSFVEAIGSLLGLNKKQVTALEAALDISDKAVKITARKGYNLQAELAENTVSDNRFGELFKVKAKGAVTKEYMAFSKFADSVPEEGKPIVGFIDDFKDAFAQTSMNLVDKDVRKYNYFSYLFKSGVDEGIVAEVDGIDDNVVTAMAFAGLNWMASSGTASFNKTPEDVKRLLGMNEDDVLPQETYLEYALEGDDISYVAQNIGQNFTRNLRIQPNDESMIDDLGKLEASVGLAILNTLSVLGGVELKAAKKFNSETNKTYERQTARLMSDGSNETIDVNLKSLLQTITKESKHFDPLFNLPLVENRVLFEPSSEVTNTTNRFGVPISDDMKKGLEKQQQAKWFAKEDNIDTFLDLPESLQQKIIGIVNPMDVPLYKRKGQEAANKANLRSIEELREFYTTVNDKGNGVENTPVYFTYSVWKNARIGMNKHIINPQANKLHRAMVGLGENRSTIDPNNSQDVEDYWIAVGQAFGIDKGTKEQIVYKTRRMANRPAVVAAVEGMKAYRTKDESTFEKGTDESYVRVMEEAMDILGNNPHAFEGLIALSQYDAYKPFDTTITKEIDGVTNGPIIALLQFMRKFNPEMAETLTKGKIYSTDQLEDAANDLYLTLVDNWNKESKDTPVKRFLDETLGKINKTTGEVTSSIGRQEGKDPLVKAQYGAGLSTLVEEFADNRIEAVIEHIRSIETNLDIPSDTRNKMVNDVVSKFNQAFNLTNQEAIKLHKDGIYETVITKQTTKKVREGIKKTYGAALDKALKNTVGDALTGNSVVTDIAAAQFEMFNGAWNYLLGRDPSKITVGMEKEFQEKYGFLMPSMPFYSATSSDQRIIPLKREDAIKSNENVVFTGKKPILMQGKDSPMKSLRFSGLNGSKLFSAPGVAPVSMYVQGLDAATMHEIYQKTETFGVHDAIITGATNHRDKSEMMNEGFFNVVREQSIIQDSAALLRTNIKKLRYLNNEELNKTVFNSKFTAALNKLSISTANEENTPELADIKGDFERRMFLSNRAKTMKPSVSLQMLNGYVKDVSDARETAFNEISYINQYENGDFGYYPEYKDSLVKDVLSEAIESVKSSTDELGNPFTRNSVEYHVDNGNALNVFDHLRSLNQKQADQAHKENLRDIVSGLISKVADPVKVRIQELNIDPDVSLQDGDIVINAMSSTANPIGLDRSTEELFTYQLVHNAIKSGLETDSVAKKTIYKLFKKAMESDEVSPRTFMEDPSLPVTSTAYKSAEALYNKVFLNLKAEEFETVSPTTGIKTKHARNDYLASFMALAMTNQKFGEAVNAVKDVKLDEDKTLLGRVTNAFDFLITRMMAKFSGSSSELKDQLLRLGYRLGGVEYHYEGVLGYVTGTYDKAHRLAGRKLADWVTQPMKKFLQSRMYIRSRGTTATILGNLAQTAPVIQYKDFAAVMRRMRKRSELLRKGFAAEIITEMKATTPNNAVLHDILQLKNHTVDQARKHERHYVSEFIKESFNIEMTPEKERAITQGFLRTDLQSIGDQYDSLGLTNLFRNQGYLENEINKVRAELSGHEDVSYFLTKAAEDLGNYMMTGQFKEHYTGKNAFVIANLINTGRSIPSNYDPVAVEQSVSKLATLTAIKLMPLKEKIDLVQAINDEFSANDVSNGFTTMLEMSADFDKQSLESLFRGNKVLTRKGFVKEIYDDNVSMMFVDELEKDSPLLTKDGYEVVGKVKRDPDVDFLSTTQMYLVASNWGLKGRMDAGIISLTNKGTQGTDLASIMRNQGAYTSKVAVASEAQNISNMKRAAIQGMFTNAPTASDTSKMITTLNEAGQVANYRYEMSSDVRDEVLNRSNDFGELMGAMFGSIVDKVNSAEVNRRVVEELHKQWVNDYNYDPKNFRYIGSDAIDEDSRIKWASLPSDMKQEVYSVWGSQLNGIMVKHEHVPLLFGGRKPSVTQLRNIEASDPSMVNQVMRVTNNTLNRLLNNKWGKRSEDVWKEVVSDAKDAIVIKSGAVTAGNITSNALLLRLAGVASKDIISGHAEAYTGALKYMSDMEELTKLKLRSKYQDKNSKVLKAAILRLEDQISSNPVTPLMDIGLFQNIIEDVELENPEKTYKASAGNAFRKRAEKYIPKGKGAKFGKDVVKNIFMTHDTKVYQVLRDAAQLSDFAARFVMHKHQVENGMDAQESIRDVVETFVNYDLPTHKSLQYANEMGLLMFSKYTLRTQKVILKLLRRHPENALIIAGLQSLTTDLPDVVGDSNLISTNLAYKFNLLPFDLAAEIIDIPTINAIREAI